MGRGTAGGHPKLCPSSPPASPGQQLWVPGAGSQQCRVFLQPLDIFPAGAEPRPQICHLRGGSAHRSDGFWSSEVCVPSKLRLKTEPCPPHPHLTSALSRSHILVCLSWPAKGSTLLFSCRDGDETALKEALGQHIPLSCCWSRAAIQPPPGSSIPRESRGSCTGHDLHLGTRCHCPKPFWALAEVRAQSVCSCIGCFLPAAPQGWETPAGDGSTH